MTTQTATTETAPKTETAKPVAKVSDGTLRKVKGILVAPPMPADTSTGVHARNQKCPKYGDTDILVLNRPDNPKRANTACHSDYEIGAKAIGTKGCTVKMYKAAMEKAGRKALIPAEISWQLRAGFWGLKRGK